MPRLALHLLGTPHLERLPDGNEIHIGRRKAMALLAYLAMERRRHSRDALAAFLWPEFDQQAARGQLRRTLSSLNRTLGEGWLITDRETAALSRSEPRKHSTGAVAGCGAVPGATGSV